MSIAAHIESALALPSMVVNMYLEDLSDDDLMVRPSEGMNHIKWQLGHLIGSQKFHTEQMFPNSMPALPDGFADRHTRETAGLDDSAAFCSKEEYIAAMNEQRAGALKVVKGLSDEDLLQPAPEAIQYFGPTIGAVFSGEATHWMMHAGQWAVVRRRLGRPPLF